VFNVRVRPDGGEPFEVETTSRDIVRWEAGGNRQTPRSMSRLSDELRMTDVTDLAWYAASRQGLTTLDLRQWREQVDIDITSKPGDDDEDDDDDSAGVGPTPAGR
jgi:hypothetical protein